MNKKVSGNGELAVAQNVELDQQKPQYQPNKTNKNQYNPAIVRTNKCNMYGEISKQTCNFVA